MATKVQAKPIEIEYPLPSDATGETVITVRQATVGDTIRLATLFQNQRQVWNDDQIGEVAIEKKFNFPELKRKRTFLTITNVVGIVDEDTGMELFQFTETSPRRFKSEAHFNDIWDRISDALAEEIYDVVTLANPQWAESGN